MSSTDYHVPYLSEDSIAIVANACWRIGAVPGSTHVSLQTILDELQAHGVESIFELRGRKLKGRLTIEIVDDDFYEDLAYVQFAPRLTLFVQRSVWARFREGRSEERVVIAHEIGHIMLHDNEAKPFSRDKSKEIQFKDGDDDGHSAEWQANRLTDHLLVPTSVAQALNESVAISVRCNVPEKFADERLSNVRKVKKKLNNCSSGEPCPCCGNFSISSEQFGKCSTPNCSYSISGH